MSAVPVSVEELRASVAELLQEDPAEIGVDDDLTLWGLDSIRLMTLIERWRSGGVELDFADLAETPTLAGWWALFEKRRA